MVETAFELMEYLAERGAPYGISAEEIFEQIPDSAQSPKVAYEYMQLKDISHIEPLSQGGEPAGDNWVLEDSSVNRSRGAQTMTKQEIATAQLDGEIDAIKLAAKVATPVATAVAVDAIGPTVAAGVTEVFGAALAPWIIGGAVCLAVGYTGFRFISFISKR